MTDILTVLNNIGYTNVQDFGTHYRCRPIYRESDNPTSLSVKKTTGEWHDFGISVGGQFQDLIFKTLNLPTGTDIKTVIPDYSVPTVIHTVELTETKKFDKSYLTKLVKDNSYWNNRGIDNTVLEPLLGGITVTAGRMKDRYVFPIFDKDNLIGFTGRTLNNSGIKWKHLGKKTEWLFPHISLPEIQKRKSVILVESPGDAISLWEIGIKNVLAIFGTKVSPKIVCFLLKIDVNTITILLNNDYDNNFIGNKAGEEATKQLSRHFDLNQIRNIVPPKPFNDLNEMLIKDRDAFIEFSKTNLITP